MPFISSFEDSISEVFVTMVRKEIVFGELFYHGTFLYTGVVNLSLLADLKEMDCRVCHATYPT